MLSKNATNGFVKWNWTAVEFTTVTLLAGFCIICSNVELDPGAFRALSRELTSPGVTPEVLKYVKKMKSAAWLMMSILVDIVPDNVRVERISVVVVNA